MYPKEFYPTPDLLISRMVSKVDWDSVNYVLEPSGGDGQIVEYLKSKYFHRRPEIHAIEKDRKLRATLRGLGHKVVGRDFLGFSGPDKYDLIIANPPFSEGVDHLLKALDIMYSGQIVFLLNKETLENTYSNKRKELVKRLKKLDFQAETIKDAFKNADRKASVDVILLKITISKKIEDDLFDGISDASDHPGVGVDEGGKEITKKDSIENMVTAYNRLVAVGTETILSYYRNYRHIKGYMSLVVEDDGGNTETDLTTMAKRKLNNFLRSARKSYWRKMLDFDLVRNKLTEKKWNEFEERLKSNSWMDFTESNVRQFIINLIDGYESYLLDAVEEVFDFMTKHAYWDDAKFRTENIHYFNGWKTNDAFKVRERVVLPMSYDGSAFFCPYMKHWRVNYGVDRKLNDIDKVANYFSAEREYVSITSALNKAFIHDETRTESTYFEIKVHKKGTMHLTWRNPDILRRFNVAACKKKNWLPMNYGNKRYSECGEQEKSVVKSFEGEEIYEKNISDSKFLFINKNLPQLPE